MKDIPLVLIHGYPFDHTLWFSTVAALGSSARVLLPDLPGFGRTEMLVKTTPSMDAYADFIAGVLDEHRFEKAVLAGMSMGGYVALAFAERFTRRVAGLGLISTQAAADTNEARQARKEMINKIRLNGPSVAVEAVLPKMFAETPPPELAAYPAKAAEAAGTDALCWALEAMANRPDRTAFAQQLHVPVLVAHGVNDRIVPSIKARQFAEGCQDPIWVEFRGVGHASPLEAPDQLAAALIRLMNRVRETRSPGASASV